MINFDINKTLDELEGVTWGEPNFNSSLVINCHRLRKVSIKNFRDEDLRLMIGQGFSLEYLVPVAVEKLKENPLASGDFFEGALLKTVIVKGDDVYNSDFNIKMDLKNIVEQVVKLDLDIKHILLNFLNKC